MTKSRINVTVDLDVAIAVKTNPDINVSKSVNNFLRTLFAIDDVQGTETEKMEELSLLKEKNTKIQEKISLITAEIHTLHSRRDAKFKRMSQEMKDFKASGAYDEMVKSWE